MMISPFETILIILSCACLLHAWIHQGHDFFLCLLLPGFLLGLFSEQFVMFWNDLYRLKSGFWKIGNIPVVAGFWWLYLFYMAIFFAEGITGGALRSGKRVWIIFLLTPIITASLGVFVTAVSSIGGLLVWNTNGSEHSIYCWNQIPLALIVAYAGFGLLFVMVFYFFLSRRWRKDLRMALFIISVPFLALIYQGWFWSAQKSLSWVYRSF